MTGYLTTLTGLCLIRLIVDMILPEGESRRFADLGAGLLTMLWTLRALISLLRGLP